MLIKDPFSFLWVVKGNYSYLCWLILRKTYDNNWTHNVKIKNTTGKIDNLAFILLARVCSTPNKQKKMVALKLNMLFPRDLFISLCTEMEMAEYNLYLPSTHHSRWKMNHLILPSILTVKCRIWWIWADVFSTSE